MTRAFGSKEEGRMTTRGTEPSYSTVRTGDRRVGYSKKWMKRESREKRKAVGTNENKYRISQKA